MRIEATAPAGDDRIATRCRCVCGPNTQPIPGSDEKTCSANQETNPVANRAQTATVPAQVRASSKAGNHKSQENMEKATSGDPSEKTNTDQLERNSRSLCARLVRLADDGKKKRAKQAEEFGLCAQAAGRRQGLNTLPRRTKRSGWR